MTNSSTTTAGPDEKHFSDLIGREFLHFIFENVPRKVGARVGKALDHFDKAMLPEGVDEEMGAIRLIAAEEELVVAIFEWLKLNTSKVPQHGDFIKKHKNHRVKLAFYPVLSQFRFALGDMISGGMTLVGLEGLIHWKIKPVLFENKVQLQISDATGREIIKQNPLAIAVSQGDTSDEQVVEELFKDFTRIVGEQQGMTVRDFVSARAEYRNKLLYADDAGYVAMDDDLKSMIEAFKLTYRDLLWSLAVLLGNTPPNTTWGLVSQFIALYRRVLTECKLV